MQAHFKALLFVFLLAGCASRPDQPQENGLLVVSVTQQVNGPLDPPHYTQGPNPVADFRLQRPDGRSRWLTPVGWWRAVRIPWDGNPGGGTGRLYVLPLPPGEYAIDAWSVVYRNVLRQTGLPASPPPPLRFNIQPGQIRYIGNLHMEIDMGGEFADPYNVVALWPKLRDEQLRDLALLASKKPEAAKAAEIDLLPLGDWGIPVTPSLKNP